MKSIHRLLPRFGIVSAIALVLLSSAYAATLERQASGTTFLPPVAVVAFTVPIPQPLAPEPALVRVGTPVQDCRDFSNLDRTIEACRNRATRLGSNLIVFGAREGLELKL